MVLLLLSSVSYKIFCPTYLHSLMIWLWWGSSIFILIPHHRMLDSYLVFWSLSISINTLTFLPTFSHSFDLLICSSGCNVLSVRKSGLIVGPSHKLSSTKSYNQSASNADLINSELIRYPNTNATELAQHYDSVLHTLINLHAPLVINDISLKPPNPWMTPAILASKQHSRYLECVWRRNPTALNRSRLTRQTHLCNRQMSKAKSTHYSKFIAQHSGDHGSLRKAFNKILHRCPKMHLPDHSSIVALANTFSSFFINKISFIHSSFPSDSHSRVLNPPDTRKVLQNISCVTADEVRHLVLRAPSKSSESSEGLHWHFNNTNNIYDQLIAHWRLLPFIP